MPTFILDGRRMTSPEAFWREYLDVVRPEGAEYFGRNLPAFNDAISGGGPGWPGEDVALEISYSAIALERLPQQFIQRLKEICQGHVKLEWL